MKKENADVKPSDNLKNHQKTDTPSSKRKKRVYKKHIILSKEQVSLGKEINARSFIYNPTKTLVSEGMKMLICFHVGFLIVLLGFLVIKLVPVLDKAMFDKTCFFIADYHIYCPGCGGTRALFSVLRLDFVTAFKHNAFAVVLFFTLIYVDIRTVAREIKGRRCKPSLPSVPYFSRYLLIILIISFIFSFVIKNLLLLWGIDPTGEIGNYWVNNPL
ncbi:MAG: DUF2752 domain-containing protein [Clostridia bacterium]|nr:DUF2752 domain-containing protein [Clostridia bacterium]